MPPIHWGRVRILSTDIMQYQKLQQRRAVIEYGLKYWVSLRQTGIISQNMLGIDIGITFHNCLDNVLEYMSDKDLGVLLKNICKDLPEGSWS